MSNILEIIHGCLAAWVDNNGKIQKTENFILIQGNIIYWAYHFVYLDINAN